MDTRCINFGAGPSALPPSVLEETCKGLLNFEGTGMGIAEISHRSKEFAALLAKLEANIRTQLQVPPTHAILFMQGGGTGQLSSIVLNMLARHRLLHPDLGDHERAMDYVVTGAWSKKAVAEAQRLGGGVVHIAVDARLYSKDSKSFDNIPTHDSYNFSPDPALIFYCENETIDGVQFSYDDASPVSFPFHLLKKDALLPLVADYSSSFMSRPIPHLADHAIIFAGAQKNIGPAGLTIAIVRQDCIVDVDAAAKLGAASVPITMAYKTIFDEASLHNTPPVIPLYVASLVLQRMADQGGLKHYEEVNKRKAEKLYAAIERPRAPEARSWMNVVFDVLGEGAEARFIEGAAAQNLKTIKGHRSVGGIRISLYNAVTEEETDQLVAYMEEFIASAEPAAIKV
ncbi:phosphoserine aminotransferase [Athelia psychrophila]|uniref:phosphoserine transaminase n=1 Tax=Athelia psychrophila TaxID=1759441 RepID=A0A166BD16_9AGAM|nr:phosphoserine aminotransferase [Fibularhizoctonia sp. CBS 109695]